MSRSRDYVWQIALTLQHHQIIPPVTDEIIQQACEDLRGKSGLFGTPYTCLKILQTLMSQDSDRFFSFKTDIEPDNCEEAAQIIRELAQATMGEWEQASISSSTLVGSSTELTQAIDFDLHREHFHWEFTICPGKKADWQMNFYMQLDAFLETHLNGTFFALFRSLTGPVDIDACYLPRQVAADLQAIQEMMEAEFIDDSFAAFVKEL